MAKGARKAWKNKRKKPITEQRSVKDTKTFISEVHRLNQELEKVRCNFRLTTLEREARIHILKEKIEKLGGLAAYQHASKKGEEHHGKFNSAKWVVGALEEVRAANTKSKKSRKFDLLDVGAVSLNYGKQASWISCTAIDLNPQEAGIVEADFFQFKPEKCEVYDVIVLSLVLNFVGTPFRRGRMLSHCSQLCKASGYLFLVMPLPCVENSRYMNHQLLNDIMESLAFKVVKEHKSRKLAFKMYQKVGKKQHKEFRKKKVHDGVNCNNFSITLLKKTR